MPGSNRGAHGRRAPAAVGDLPTRVSTSLDRQIIRDSGGPPALVVRGKPTRSAGGPPDGSAYHPSSVALTGESRGEPLLPRGVGPDDGRAGQRGALRYRARYGPGGGAGPH